MKRVALVFGAVSLLLFVDAIYLLATHKNPNGDTGVLFGNPHNFLSSGTIVLISALLVLVVSVAMWLVGIRREDQERQDKHRRPAGGPPTSEQSGPSGRTASAA